MSFIDLKKNYLQFYDICGYKKWWNKNLFPLSLVLLLDPRSGMGKNRDPVVLNAEYSIPLRILPVN